MFNRVLRDCIDQHLYRETIKDSRVLLDDLLYSIHSAYLDKRLFCALNQRSIVQPAKI